MSVKIYPGEFDLWQWDRGRRLVVDDTDCCQVHFYNGVTQEVLAMEVYEQDGLRVVKVPDILLQVARNLTVYTYKIDDTGAQTRHSQVFTVYARLKPADYVYTEDEIHTWEELEKRVKALEENGALPDEVIAEAVKAYLEENPIEAGATAEEAAQIKKNKKDIQNLSNDKLDASKLSEAVDDALAQAKASGEFEGEPGYTPVRGKDYWTTEDKESILSELSAVSDELAIVNEGKGSVVAVSDSVDRHLRGLTIYGKTTQDGTPTPDSPVELVGAGASGAINVTVAGKKIFDDAEWFKKNNATLQNDGSWNGVSANKIIFTNSSRKSGSVNLAMTAKIDRDTTTASLQVTYTDNTSDNFCAFQLANDFETKIAETNPDKTVESIALQTSGNTNGLYVKDIMVAFGDNEYDPAIDKQTLTVSTPNGLNGVPMPTDGGTGGYHYIPDYIDENGNAYITDYVDISRGVRVQRFKTAVITQTSQLVAVKNGFGQFGINLPTGRKDGSYCLCSHYKVPLNYDGSLWSNPTYTGVMYKRVSSNPNKLFTVHEGITTLEDYNAWLAENKPVFLYELLEPIEIPLSAEEIAAYQALHTNYPDTTIYTDAGVGLDVKYVADTKSYVDQKLAAISAALLNA